MRNINRGRNFRKIISLVVVAFFSFSTIMFPSTGYAQGILNLPTPGTMVTMSPSYTPAIVTGITLYPDDPLRFDFIIDVGDDNLEGEVLRKESQKLINYFMAALTVPEDEMWVNLSPYEKDRIVAEGLGNTELGRDLLAQDYILKQITASLMNPEGELGNKYWQKVHKLAQEKFGTTEIPTNTFNKIWIVPEEAVIYINGTNIFVADSHLKVMLEEDYLALEHHDQGLESQVDSADLTEETKAILREVFIPEIEREVNEGKNFANLRQIYHSVILATWYKHNLKESLLGQVYVDQNKVSGVDIEDKDIKNKIYNQYVEAFKKGVYDFIKEDYDSATQQIIPRKYFSGGMGLLERTHAGTRIAGANGVPSGSILHSKRRKVRVTEQTQLNGEGDSAMLDLDKDEIVKLIEEVKEIGNKYGSGSEKDIKRLQELLIQFSPFSEKEVAFDYKSEGAYESQDYLIYSIISNLMTFVRVTSSGTLVEEIREFLSQTHPEDALREAEGRFRDANLYYPGSSYIAGLETRPDIPRTRDANYQKAIDWYEALIKAGQNVDVAKDNIERIRRNMVTAGEHQPEGDYQFGQEIPEVLEVLFGGGGRREGTPTPLEPVRERAIEVTTESPRTNWILGGNPDAILQQEKGGQQQLVQSKQLPTAGTESASEWESIILIITGITSITRLGWMP